MDGRNQGINGNQRISNRDYGFLIFGVAFVSVERCWCCEEVGMDGEALLDVCYCTGEQVLLLFALFCGLCLSIGKGKLYVMNR